MSLRLTGAYPLGLRPALREIASLRSVTSDTPQPLDEMPEPAYSNGDTLC